MFGPFAEAVRATTQPCTVLLVVPCTVVVLVTRARWASLAAVVGAAVVGGWWFAANRFVLDGAWLQVSAAAMIFALVVVAGGGDRLGRRRLDEPWPQAGVAGVVSLIATQWWRPCVGEELGTILNAAHSDLIAQIPAMTSYMVGAMVPVVAVVLIVQVIQPSAPVLDAVGGLAAVIGIVVAGALVFGRHDEVVVTLTRWTLQ